MEIQRYRERATVKEGILTEMVIAMKVMIVICIDDVRKNVTET